MKYQPVKGVRDITPEESKIRKKILDRLKSIFERFGFQPLETPSLESWEILATKKGGGPEVLKEAYTFKDKSGRKIGLIYDLTVPLARFIASNPDLPLPFKRYQIQKVWRYGDVSKGRLREFLQCDIDTVGSDRMIADAEIIACAVFALEELGFKEFTVRLNSRKILTAMVEKSGVKKEKVNDVLRSLDKLEKIGDVGVKEELKNLGISLQSIESLLKMIKTRGDSETILNSLEKSLGPNEGITELREILSFLKILGIFGKVKVDVSLARGLDYYTGPIFEISAGKGIGSIAGGGRYDELIGIFSGRKVPATGISFGIERMIEIMKDKKMVAEESSQIKVFVASASDEVRANALDLACKLRNSGIYADLDLKKRNLSRQLEYANGLGIPFVAIVGKQELQRGVVKLKDMKERKEYEVNKYEILKKLSDR